MSVVPGLGVDFYLSSVSSQIGFISERTMIESSPFTANLSKIDLSREDYENLIEGIRDTPYTKDRSFGFVSEATEEDHVSANLVFRTATMVQDINESTQEIEPVEQKRTDLIPFEIDYDRGLLAVFANKEDTRKLTTRLSSLADWGITIDPLSLDLNSLYEHIATGEHPVSITGLRIRDFSINEYTNGSYHLKVFENHEGERLLDEYGSDVSYLTIEFEVQSEAVTVGFYDSGTVRFYSKTTEDEELMQQIKGMISELQVS